jgi:ABC-type transporter Mla MlaB component
MKSKNVTHSKVKNSGILFELLVRQITVDTLEGQENPPSVSMMKKYFHPSTELGKELQMHRSFFDMKTLTEVKASQFIDLVSDQRAKLNEKKLLTEKYNLVKDIKKNYGESFFNTKIPFYKTHASIYKTFMAEVCDFDVSNLQEIASARFSLIEHLTQDKKQSLNTSEVNIMEEFKNQTEDLRLITYKILLERFNEKYTNLNERQKDLLRNYITSISNSEKFTEYVHNQIDPLITEITSLVPKEKDKVLRIKLNEVKSQLSNMKEHKSIKDNELTALMIAYQIVEELKTK